MRTIDFASKRRFVGLLHLTIVSTSLLSLASYWLDYPTLFLILAPVCTLITLLVSFSVAHYTSEGIGFVTFFNAALFLGIGAAIDRSFYPGIFVGGAIYGLAYMVPVAVTDFMIDYSARKAASIRMELQSLKEELRETVAKEEPSMERAMEMSSIFHDNRSTVADLRDQLDRLISASDSLERLRDYYDHGEWDRDRLALTAEAFGEDDSLEEFFSEKGLPQLFDQLDELLETLSEIAAEAGTE